MRLEWGPYEGQMTWDAAVKLSKSKGDGWRLPTVAELVGQYDYDADKPKDSGWRGWCWSSSPDGGLYAWSVNFDHGRVFDNFRGNGLGVRCVREVDGISIDRSDESRKHHVGVVQECAGRCGKERELSSKELVLWNLHGPLKWWSQPCAERMEAEKLWTPMVEALEKCPTLRAKLREILEVK